MRRQEPMRDRFQQYLNSVVGRDKADRIINNSQKAQNRNCNYDFYSTPRINRLGFNQQQSEQSLNSSWAIQSSNSSTIVLSNTNKTSQRRSGKTVSIKQNKKRLRKLAQKQENTCSICLQQIQIPAVMSCKHSYCIQCLSEWLKTSSTCPYCRNDSTFYTYQGKQHLIQQKAYRHQSEFPEVSDDDDDQLDYQCYLCQITRQGDTVLICDRCFIQSAHPECDLRLRGVELGQDQEWYCHFCSS